MFILRRRKRNPTILLAPRMKHIYFNPRRCYKSGAEEKYQMPYPPPWMNKHKNFNNPKKLPLEIDHLDWREWHDAPANLRWISRLMHIERGEMDPTRRRRQARGGRFT